MEIVERNGKKYIRTEFTIDHGKDGVTRVEVLDPCITEESQRLRREALVQKCLERMNGRRVYGA